MTTLNLLILRWLSRRRIEAILAIAALSGLATPLLLWISGTVVLLKLLLAFGLGSILVTLWCIKLLEMDE